MSRETPSRTREKVATRATLLFCSVLGLMQGSCTTQTISTPTRSLDRPSDAALFCVDYELDYDGNHCLPQAGNPDQDPQGYLDSWCSDTSWRDITPKATVLAFTECDESHRRLRSENYLAKVRQAARSIGRDPDWPCCPSDNTACGTQAPACARRALSMVIANTSRGELAVANTNLQPPGLSTIGRLQNLHDGEPGFGFLPTGLLPEHVRAYSPPETKLADGRTVAPNAWAVTTNTGSCDVSVLQLQLVADLTRRADSCDDSGQACATKGCDAQSCPKQIRPWFADSRRQPHAAASASRLGRGGALGGCHEPPGARGVPDVRHHRGDQPRPPRRDDRAAPAGPDLGGDRLRSDRRDQAPHPVADRPHPAQVPR